MFILDTSLPCIEAEEADVIEIHRSAEPVSVSPGDRAPRPCNAFVCAIRQQEAVRVYVALEQADRKGSFIYRPDESSAKEPPERLVGEALSFASSLGFAMQEVNLKYSKAMREVVIRDVRVIRRPAGPRMMDEAVVGKAPPEPAPSGQAASARDEEVKPEKGRAGRAEAMQAEADWLVAEKAAAEKAWSELRDRLSAEIERLGKEKEEFGREAAAQEALLRAEVERLAGERKREERESDDRLAPLKKEAERLTKELESLKRKAAPQRALLEKEIAGLEAEKGRVGEAAAREETRLRGELESLRAELERLAAGKAEAERSGAERSEALQGEIAGLTAAKAEAEAAAAARIGELEAEVRRVAAERAEEEARAAADIADLEDLVGRLAAERETARKGAIDRLARLVAEAELISAEKEAVERVIAVKGSGAAEVLAKSEAELVALRSEVVRLASAKALAEQTATARIAGLQAEVERLSAQQGSQAAGRRVTREPAIVPSLHRPAVEEPSPPLAKEEPPGPAAAVLGAGSTAVWDEEVEAAAGTVREGEAGGEVVDPFAFMGGEEEFVSFGAPGEGGASGPAAAFRLRKDLDCIEYGAPEEVIELHHALNMVNISPEGHAPQTCGAYICALRRGERYRVFVAWLLTADRKTHVYAPEKQPANAQECTKAVRDAFVFVETVGFMMDSVRLSTDLEKRARALAKIPVLCLKG